MSTSVATTKETAGELMEKVIIEGDLSKLSSADRIKYYNHVCESLGLNPFTQPFSYIRLNNKLVLYAKKDCADQLRNNRNISIRIISREDKDGVCEVTARATTPDGREDEDVGAVNVKGLSGDSLANARMKACTKAKRRVTLSICGLGFLDETEVETVPHAEPAPQQPKQIEQRHDPKLFTAMIKKDQALTKAGVCKKGELLDHLSRLGAQAEFGAKLETWQGPKATVFAADAIKRFEEFAKQSCTPVQEKEIDALFNKLEVAAEDREIFLSERGIAAGEIMTERKARDIIAELKKLVADNLASAPRQPGDEPDDEIPY